MRKIFVMQMFAKTCAAWNLHKLFSHPWHIHNKFSAPLIFLDLAMLVPVFLDTHFCKFLASTSSPLAISCCIISLRTVLTRVLVATRSLTQRTAHYMRHVMTVVHVLERERLNISVRNMQDACVLVSTLRIFYNFTFREIKSPSLSKHPRKLDRLFTQN